VIPVLQVLLSMDATLIAQFRMVGIAMVEMTLMRMDAMKFAVTPITLETLIAMIATLILEMVAMLIVRLKMDGIATFQ
jgi:hypothetical protein